MTETLSLFDELFETLSKTLPSYEARDDQQAMAREIWEAFEKEMPALFEAGTGIGKSLAYLIPALLWSYKTGEKVVISTYTISLQEQLLEKDIPLLLQTLGLDLRVVLAKGMGNYVCLRKLEDVQEDGAEVLTEWAHKTRDGTKSALPFSVSSDLWSEVRAESENCSYVKCPHYEECFFFKARRKAQMADLIIVNHHLLMAHLLADEKQAVLPPFSRLIVDEAHHLETVARSALTRTLDKIPIFRILAKVHTELLPTGEDKALALRTNVDLPGAKSELSTKVQKAFDLLDDYFQQRGSHQKWRLTTEERRAPSFQNKLLPHFDDLNIAMKRYIASLDALEDEFDEEQKRKGENLLLDIAGAVL